MANVQRKYIHLFVYCSWRI